MGYGIFSNIGTIGKWVYGKSLLTHLLLRNTMEKNIEMFFPSVNGGMK